MPAPFTQNFKIGFSTALYEYLVITMPVCIYVSLEAIHKDSYCYIYKSPEWSIATIFLCFISLSRYLSSISKSGRETVEPIIGIISLVNLAIIIASTINAYISIDKESNSIIYFRIALFLIATSLFLIFLTGAKLVHNQEQ